MQEAEDQAFQDFLHDLQAGKLSFAEAKRRYVALGKVINDRFALEITVLSLDVVQSREVKASGTALQAQATFDAYHRWVLEKLTVYGCRSYNWSGDGLIALFPRPEPAVAAARSLIDGLPDFNADQKLVARDIQIRAGIHTGPVLPHDEVTGGESIALGRLASDTLDCAAHLQKTAAPNRLVISQLTFDRLAEGTSGFAPMPSALAGERTCYVYPPTSSPPPAAYQHPPQWAHAASDDGPSPTLYAIPQPGGLPHWLTVTGLTLLGVVVALTGFWLLSHHGASTRSADGAPAVSQPATMQPVPVAGAAGPPAAAAPVGGATPTAGNAPAANGPAAASVPAPANRVPVALAPPAPDRRPWFSTDANSGVPTRVVPSPRDLRWMISIGVERYRDHGLSAEGAEASAQSAVMSLQASYGIPSDHILTLGNEQATGENIKRAFSWLQSKAVSGRDTVIVYLSGIGTVERDRPTLRHPGGSGYVFVPSDAGLADLPDTGIYGADFAAWLAATRAQTILLLADTANAGALAADLPQQTDPGRQLVLLAASGAAQKGAVGKSGQPDVFAEVLASALRGDADRNRDQRVSLEELAEYFRSEIPRRSNGAQSPEIRAGFGGYLPELYLAGGG